MPQGLRRRGRHRHLAQFHRRRARVAELIDAGAEYALHCIDFAKGEQRAPEFLAVNPKGRVPALVRVNPAPGARRMEQSVTLAEGLELKIEANIDGKASVEGSLLCRQLDAPASCTVESGDYNVSFASGGTRALVSAFCEGARECDGVSGGIHTH
ncbi:MAG: hypothetical protein HC793_04175 [Aquincola sp.]|nr:hypothetical protein [Aquincola sp.]